MDNEKNSKISKFKNLQNKKKKNKKFFASKILFLFVLCVFLFFLSLSFCFYYYFLSFCIFQKHQPPIVFIFYEIPPLFCVFQQYSRPFRFSCRHVVLLERRFSLVTTSFAQPLPCGNVHWGRLLCFSAHSCFNCSLSEVWWFRTTVELLSDPL